MIKYPLLASLALLAASPSSAATIAGLFNTGTDADNLAPIGTAGAVNAIPEPATCAMMIIGGGAVGTFARAARRIDAPSRVLA